MKKVFVVMAGFVLLGMAGAVQADVFNMGPGLTNLEMVTVGDPENAADSRYQGRGSVSITYQIGKYEVTSAQYCEFLNAKAATDPYGLWNSNMAVGNARCGIQRLDSSGYYTYVVDSAHANLPVNYVGYWDACRFVNWLGNGQGNGDTETGTYALNGYQGSDGAWIGRNTTANWFIPNVSEWYKAAYYKGGSCDAGYWEYATQSNGYPNNVISSPDSGNSANFTRNGYRTPGAAFNMTNVGEFENSESAYGTFDQMGNVWEWSETLYNSHGAHIRIGGSWEDGGDHLGAGALLDGTSPYEHRGNTGFRIAAVVSEPSGLLVLGEGLWALAWLRRRRA